MKRIVPTAVAIAAGLIVLADAFVTNSYLHPAAQTLVGWAALVGASAMLLGLLNVLGVHWSRIRKREGGWSLSLVLIAAMLIVLALGLIPGGGGVNAPGVAWMFNYIQVPLEATTFSLLAFFMLTAAYRTWRVRGVGSALLLMAAVVVLLGQIPLGERLWNELPAWRTWVLGVPSLAGARGIILGVALATVATGVRILLGLDRSRFFN